MIRPSVERAGLARLQRRQLLRVGFFTGVALAALELAGILPAFVRVLKIEGLGAELSAGRKEELLAQFARTNDAPILNQQGRFFVLHAPGGIVAAYRKCTHLGCAVPWSATEDQFHCPCHGSLYDKQTALKKGGPAPRGLDLFHIWHPDQMEVPV